MLLSPPEPADWLSTVLTQARFRGVVGGAIKAGGRWAISLPRHEALKVHVLLRGSCWVQHRRQRLQLVAGDCLITTGAEPLVFASESPAKRITPVEALLPSARQGLVTIQSGRDVFSVTIAAEFDGHLHRLLFSGLPALIHVPESADESVVLRWTVERLRTEYLNAQPGRAVVLSHLAPILLVQGLRAYLRVNSGDASWLRAASHPKLSRVIEAVHSRCSHPWSLDGLAQLAGLSRSSFAANFREQVGLSPMAYVAQTRIQAARELLRTGELNVAGVAAAVGYESESAFSVAFNKVVGCRPGVYARRPER